MIWIEMSFLFKAYLTNMVLWWIEIFLLHSLFACAWLASCPFWGFASLVSFRNLLQIQSSKLCSCLNANFFRHFNKDWPKTAISTPVKIVIIDLKFRTSVTLFRANVKLTEACRYEPLSHFPHFHILLSHAWSSSTRS